MKYDYKLKNNAIETLKACANENGLLNKIISHSVGEDIAREWESVAAEVMEIFYVEGQPTDMKKAVFCCTCVIGVILDEVIDLMEKKEKGDTEWPLDRKSAKKGKKVKFHSPIFDLSTKRH